MCGSSSTTATMATSGPCDLVGIRRQCAERLLQQLRDPQVRAEKALSLPVPEQTISSYQPDKTMHHRPETARAPASPLAVEQLLPRDRKRRQRTPSTPIRSRPMEPAKSAAPLLKDRSSAPSSCTPSSPSSPARHRPVRFSQPSGPPAAFRRTTPLTSRPGVSCGNGSMLRSASWSSTAGHGLTPDQRDLPRSRPRTGGRVGARHDVAAHGQIAPAGDTAEGQQLRRGPQVEAALALRRLVACGTPPAAPASAPSTTGKGTERASPAASTESESRRRAAPLHERRRSSSAGPCLRGGAASSDHGQEGLQESLVDTVRRLCELEHERRRLFDEYDGMFSKINVLHSAPSKSPGVESPSAPPLVSSPSTARSAPLGSSPATARSALAAAHDRAHAQLEALLQRTSSGRLRAHFEEGAGVAVVSPGAV